MSIIRYARSDLGRPSPATGTETVARGPLAGVRGRGLWLALELDGVTSAAVEKASRDSGFLVNAVQPDAVRIAPPLILSTEDADSYVAALPSILDAAVQAGLAGRGA